jgi:hypothetical protein
MGFSKLLPASPLLALTGADVTVAGIGVRVGSSVAVDVGMGVSVGRGVKVAVGITVGPNTCPGPQAETMKLINKQVTIVWKCFFMENSFDEFKQNGADLILKSTAEVGEMLDG